MLGRRGGRLGSRLVVMGLALHLFGGGSLLLAFHPRSVSATAVEGPSVARPAPAQASIQAEPAAAHRPSIGLNKFDLFLQYLGLASGGDGGPAFQRVTTAMARKAMADARDTGVRYLRVSATGYAPSAYGRPGDLDLWRHSPTEHWRLFDQMLADLEAYGLRIVPVFVWNWTQFPAMSGETSAQLITNPDSQSSQLLATYIEQFVTRYRQHPSIYFYELTNELNLYADLDQVKKCWKREATRPELCGPMGNFTTNEMINFTGRLADLIRSLDDSRPISSGHAMPLPYAQHLRNRPEFSLGGPDRSPDSRAEFEQILRHTHAGLDVVSVHFYNEQGWNQRFDNLGHDNAGLLRVVKQASDEMNKQLFVGEFADVAPHVSENAQAPFSTNVQELIVELQIPYSAAWVWQFYQLAPYKPEPLFNLEPGLTDSLILKLRDANARLGNHAPQPTSPDIVPPRVVLSWPLEGATISCNQPAFAVASDDSGSVSRVSFTLDGHEMGSAEAPPYLVTLPTRRLTPGTHELRAVAYDRAGNQASYTVTAHYDPAGEQGCTASERSAGQPADGS